MNLNPNDLPEDAAVVVCETTNSPHVEDVKICQCDFCGTDVWFAKSTENLVAKHDKVYKMCINCAMKHNALDDHAIPMPSDEQLMDVAKRVGAPFEEVKERITTMIKAQNIHVAAKYN
jgi:hypothetical protein